MTGKREVGWKRVHAETQTVILGVGIQDLHVARIFVKRVQIDIGLDDRVGVLAVLLGVDDRHHRVHGPQVTNGRFPDDPCSDPKLPKTSAFCAGAGV